jgi:mannose-6-phosphate isomerase-like protein (cupin superfamily)
LCLYFLELPEVSVTLSYRFMQSRTIPIDESREYETSERCAILELSNDADDPDVSIARARVAPGVTTAWHRLDQIAERYVILTGQGLVEVSDLKPQTVGPGDVVCIPASEFGIRVQRTWFFWQFAHRVFNPKPTSN